MTEMSHMSSLPGSTLLDSTQDKKPQFGHNDNIKFKSKREEILTQNYRE